MSEQPTRTAQLHDHCTRCVVAARRASRMSREPCAETSRLQLRKLRLDYMKLARNWRWLMLERLFLDEEGWREIPRLDIRGGAQPRPARGKSPRL